MKTLIASSAALVLAFSSAAEAKTQPKKSNSTSKGKSEAQEEKPAKGGSGSPSQVCGASGLSEARQKMFAELDQVIPSVQGMKKGSGRNLFDGVKVHSTFELVDSKTVGEGVAILVYGRS